MSASEALVSRTRSGSGRAVNVVGTPLPLLISSHIQPAVGPEVDRTAVVVCVARFTAAGDRAAAGSEHVIFELDDLSNGWPSSEGPTPDPRFSSPIHAYDHSGGGCAITGAAFYERPHPHHKGKRFPSTYMGDYFFGGLCAGWIRRLDVKTGVVSDFAAGFGTIVDLQVGPDGTLYVLDRSGGRVYAISYAKRA